MSKANITIGAIGKKFGKEASVGAFSGVAGATGAVTVMSLPLGAIVSSSGGGSDALVMAAVGAASATLCAASAYAAIYLDKDESENSGFSPMMRRAWKLTEPESAAKKLLRRVGYAGGALGIAAPFALAFSTAHIATDGDIQGAVNRTLIGTNVSAPAFDAK